MKKSELLELLKDLPDDSELIVLNRIWDPKWDWVERAVHIKEVESMKSGLIILRTFKKSN